MSRIHWNGFIAVIALSVALGASGCGGSSSTYTPNTVDAKETLNQALSSWKKGEKYDALEKASPPIHVGDTQWQDGKVLESFEIVSEEPVPGEANKMFNVNLKLKGAGSATKTRYIVVGREPTWVYQEENFKRLLNMDNNPKPAGKTKAR